MTQPSDKASIEAGLEQDRQALAASMSELRHRMSPSEIVRNARGIASEGGWKSASLAVKEARTHPIGAGLISAGIAWIMFGPKGKSQKLFGKRTLPQAIDRWEDEGGQVHTPSADQSSQHANNLLSRELDELRKFASDRVHQLEVDAKGGLDDAIGAARSFAAERAGVLSDLSDDLLKKFADDLSETLDAGLEHLTDQARATATKARDQAHRARVEAERLTRNHPMMMAAVGLGIGAALAALIPMVRASRVKTAAVQPRSEDYGMGNQSASQSKTYVDRSQSHAAH